MIEDSARNLKGKFEKVGELQKLYFKNLKPEISFSATQTEWKATLGTNVAAAAVNPTELLVEALNGLEALAADLPGEKRITFIYPTTCLAFTLRTFRASFYHRVIRKENVRKKQ